MEELIVRGGKQLFGSIRVPKSKNSILPILAAAMLCEGESRICDVPRLRDVETSLELLAAVGAAARREGDAILVSAGKTTQPAVPEALSGAMRSSVYYLAPLLHRCGAAQLSFPGGCRLGKRPIDLHLSGLGTMGAKIRQEGDTVFCTAPHGLHGANFCLSFPSVGATETLMMAAVLAEGRTVLCGCAREPEITDLARFLRRCGAVISGAGGSCITIEGVKRLTASTYTPIADRITAATILFAVAACGGEVTLTGVRYAHLVSVAHLLEDMGAVLTRADESSLTIRMSDRAAAAAVTTGVYPAFPTDAGPLFAAAALGAAGTSRISETIFENRFACAEQFARMGAQLTREPKRLRILGSSALRGADVAAEDLRGGAALVIAALAAKGESRIAGTEYISRGYEDIAALFGALGAEIRLAQGEGCAVC